MTVILVVEKTGTIRPLTLKNVTEEELYKKAGFKTSTHFKIQTSWKLKIDEKQFHIFVYGKTEGKANQENKYEFPPPIDQKLFFGNVLLVNRHDNYWVDLTVEEWETIYNFLYGGFEDLDRDSGDSEADTEEEILAKEEARLRPSQITKSGYAKDGFVVEDTEESSDDSSEEEEREHRRKPERLNKKGTSGTSGTSSATIPLAKTNIKKLPVSKQIQLIKEYAKMEIQSTASAEDTTSELSEEPYVT